MCWNKMDLFEKIEEFFKDIMIDVIKDNLSAMLLDINDKVSTVAVEVGKTPSSWNSEIFAFIKSINENVVLPIAAHPDSHSLHRINSSGSTEKFHARYG